MKSLLRFKLFDFLIQVLAMLGSLLYLSFARSFQSMMIFYFLVGSIQVTSCVANISLHKRLRESCRRAYEGVLVFLLALLLLCLATSAFAAAFSELFGGLLFGCLIFLSPGFAFWYAAITWREYVKIVKYVHRSQTILQPENHHFRL